MNQKRILCTKIINLYNQFIKNTGQNIPELSRAIKEIAENIKKEEKQTNPIING